MNETIDSKTKRTVQKILLSLVFVMVVVFFYLHPKQQTSVGITKANESITSTTTPNHKAIPPAPNILNISNTSNISNISNISPSLSPSLAPSQAPTFIKQYFNLQFVHIPKTGGTTIENFFAVHFGIIYGSLYNKLGTKRVTSKLKHENIIPRDSIFYAHTKDRNRRCCSPWHIPLGRLFGELKKK